MWNGVFEYRRSYDGRVTVQGHTADVLLKDMPLPFRPPGLSWAADARGFEHWWRLLTYVFDLPDPSLFPSLGSPLRPEDEHVVRRFISQSHHLAASTIMSATGGVDVQPGSGGAEDVINVDFPTHELQTGFAVMLRQCEADSNAADFPRVGILKRAATTSDAVTSGTQLDVLEAWRAAEASLHKRSLNQLMCDAFVEREGWAGFACSDEWTPRELLETFRYGDLIHWHDAKAGLVDTNEDEPTAAGQRYAFLCAALGLAHLYVGFGQLARAAITPTSSVLVPSPRRDEHVPS